MNRDICIEVLQKELIPALGCTEPIAVAYGAAKAREVLGCFPDRIELLCSGNIIKNVKGVTVPCSKGMKGLDAAAILGTVGGDPSRELEVLSTVSYGDIDTTKKLIGNKDFFSCSLVQGVPNLYISVNMWAGEESSQVKIVDYHTNIQEIWKNGKLIFYKEMSSSAEQGSPLSSLSLEDIFTFAREVDVDLIKPILSRQVEFNSRISDYGLKENCGANIGSTLLQSYPDDVALRARARAAAASDARMSGCSLPVVINSGSGNQGITVCLPVLEYWKQVSAGEDELYRALAISNLSALYVKRYIGSLSAFCGAVVAASGAAAAIDSKVVIDDNALYRQENCCLLSREEKQKTKAEEEAETAGLVYVELDKDGDIGLIAGGAGIGMATVDTISYYGGKAYNFLDLGGGVTAEKMYHALHLLLMNPQVKRILVNVFGGINNCAVMAEGIERAYNEAGNGKPVVVKSRGFNQEEGWEIYRKLGFKQIKFGTTDEAVKLLMEEADE